MLLSYTFITFVVMALNVGLIFSIGVEDILVAFSCTGARSIIAEEP
jgi:hypothetical protein